MAATYVYGPYNVWQGNLFEFRSFLTYEVTANTSTTYSVQITAGIQVGNNNGPVGVNGILVGVSGTNQTLKQTTHNFYTTEINGMNVVYTAFTWSWTKSHSAQSIEIASAIAKSGNLEQSRGSVTLTVPARASYAVKYYANGGSGAPSAQTKWYGENLTLSSTKPTRTGYTFKGWATSSGSTTVAYNPGATYSSNAALNLYAVWEIIQYTIKYNSNGGTGSISNQTKNYGSSVTLSSGSGFSRTNYELTGWNTKSGGTGTAYAKSGTYSANASVTLYAQWTLAYTNPKISSVNVYKCDSGGNADDQGTYIHVEFNYTGGKQGDGTYIVPKCGITVTTGGTTTTARAASTSGMSTSGTFSATYGSAYSADVSHTVTITLSDSYGSVSSTKTVPTALYPLDFLGKADGSALYMGVMTPAVSGQALTLNAFRANGTSYVDGNIYANHATADATNTYIGCQQGGTTKIRIVANAAGSIGLYDVINSQWLVLVTSGETDIKVAGINLSTDAANTVLAAPNGSAGAPTFRALVAADIPNIGAGKITSGTLGVARLPNMLQTKAYSYERTTSLAAGASVALTGTNFGVSTPSNYKPVGIVYFSTSNSGAVPRGVNAGVTGSSSMMYVTNVTSSAIASFTAYITILYAYTGTVA